MKYELNVAPPKTTVNKAVPLLLVLQTAYQTALNLSLTQSHQVSVALWS